MVIISIHNVVDISRGFMIQYFEKVDEFTIFVRGDYAPHSKYMYEIRTSLCC